jgi:hypothetical protein
MRGRSQGSGKGEVLTWVLSEILGFLRDRNSLEELKSRETVMALRVEPGLTLRILGGIDI